MGTIQAEQQDRLMSICSEARASRDSAIVTRSVIMGLSYPWKDAPLCKLVDDVWRSSGANTRRVSLALRSRGFDGRRLEASVSGAVGWIPSED
jgi:hypothetical protein